MSSIIDEIEEYVNLKKNIIARIGNTEEASKIINGIGEIVSLKEKIETRFTDYIFYIKQEIGLDFRHISVYLDHISLNGADESVLKTILNYKLKNVYLYWIDCIADGFRLRYTIKQGD